MNNQQNMNNFILNQQHRRLSIFHPEVQMNRQQSPQKQHVQKQPLNKNKIVFDSADYFLETEHQKQQKDKQKNEKLVKIEKILIPVKNDFLANQSPQLEQQKQEEKLKQNDQNDQIFYEIPNQIYDEKIKWPKQTVVNPAKYILNTHYSNESIDKIQDNNYKYKDDNISPHNINTSTFAQCERKNQNSDKQKNKYNYDIDSQQKNYKARKFFDSADYFIQQDLQKQQKNKNMTNNNQQNNNNLEVEEQIDYQMQKLSDNLEKQYLACEKPNFAQFKKRENQNKNRKKIPFDSADYFINQQKQNFVQNNEKKQTQQTYSYVQEKINENLGNLYEKINDENLNDSNFNNLSQNQIKQKQKRKTLIDISWKRTCFDSAEYFLKQSQKQQLKQKNK
ncbi:hypothetical protein PPERSA_05643 [Pseudocohnilembus persalinus]|uniref:Uncharacterized protein n=1 Tax=Pseudocohnilembus persalinus TaxID=266149 RepID=A0A0V0QPX0_PSEPJ|nr:hypothetical protein PPERSA_05643 [Pseudocohnilembus persalinus]|eukprot:KRX04382.1 hypothetical protein PPERSA_05643 [Pseudocohnilembus persalinus]